MALSTTTSWPEPSVILGERVYLRYPRMADYPEWADLRGRSRAFLKPWEPSWSHDELSRIGFRHRIRRYQRLVREDLSYAFFVALKENDRLVGGCTLSNVRRGVTQCCSLGYWTGEPFAGQGLMTEAVRAVVTHAFTRMGLHRIEAACLPHNEPSKRLLQRVGFRLEGEALRYLKIDGQWRDHLLFAILEDDPRT